MKISIFERKTMAKIDLIEVSYNSELNQFETEVNISDEVDSKTVITTTTTINREGSQLYDIFSTMTKKGATPKDLANYILNELQ